MVAGVAVDIVVAADVTRFFATSHEEKNLTLECFRMKTHHKKNKKEHKIIIKVLHENRIKLRTVYETFLFLLVLIIQMICLLRKGA